MLRHLRGRLAARIDRIAPPGAVLDVGAGDGTLVDALTRRGREARGLERDVRHPLVVGGDITDQSGEWAAIVFWHSLEHLRRPGRALDHAVTLLAPGGVLFIAMPNVSSLQARFFGDRWLGLDRPRHLVHVCARSLVSRLDALGMSVERVSHVRGGQILFGWLHGLVGVLPTHPDLYEAIRRPEARFAHQSAGRRVAALAGAVAALPAALAGASAEAVTRRGGTVYVEARRG